MCENGVSILMGRGQYDETLARRMIKKITVFENHFNVEFKDGVDVNIKG